MGALLATLGFEWNYPQNRPEEIGSITMEDDKMSDEKLVANLMAHATRNLYRDKIYRCDLYRGLDERIPEVSVEDEEMTTTIKSQSLWRMNVDHPLVYVLVTEKGQQPIHIVNDRYGILVVYESKQVDEGIDYLISLCSQAGYEIFNDPVPEESN